MSRPAEYLQLRRLQLQFSLIAVTGAVLLLSFDVRDARNAALVDLVANDEVLAVHQDVPLAAGYTQRLLGGPLATSMQALRTNLSCDDEGTHATDAMKGTDTAGSVAIYATSAPASGSSVSASAMAAASPSSLLSRWRFHANTSLHGRFESVARPGWCLQASTGNGPAKCGDGVFINVSLAALMPCSPFVMGVYCGSIGEWAMEPSVLGPDGGRIVSVYATSEGESEAAMTRDVDGIPGAVWIQANYSADDMLAPLQRWRWDASRMQLITSDGRCLGAEAAADKRVNVWSRRLSGGGVALVFVNAEPSDTTLHISCDWEACLRMTGLPADARLAVRDLIRHEDLPPIAATQGIAADVPGDGGSVMLRLTPL